MNLNENINRIKQVMGLLNEHSYGKIKDGVKELFNENPILASIGSPEQYSQYLDTIFPDSKVKHIVYHRTKSEKFDVFNNGTENYLKNDTYTKDGIYFNNNINSGKEVYGKNIIAALVNIKNPYLFKEEPLFAKEGDNPKNLSINSIDKNKLDDEDGVLFKLGLKGQTIVFEPNQIHILGSKDDIIGFENFVKK